MTDKRCPSCVFCGKNEGDWLGQYKTYAHASCIDKFHDTPAAQPGDEVEFEHGVASVTSIRCVKHYKIQPMNRNEVNGGECAVCAVQAAQPDPVLVERMGSVLAGNDPYADNDEQVFFAVSEADLRALLPHHPNCEYVTQPDTPAAQVACICNPDDHNCPKHYPTQPGLDPALVERVREYLRQMAKTEPAPDDILDWEQWCDDLRALCDAVERVSNCTQDMPMSPRPGGVMIGDIEDHIKAALDGKGGGENAAPDAVTSRPDSSTATQPDHTTGPDDGLVERVQGFIRKYEKHITSAEMDDLRALLPRAKPDPSPATQSYDVTPFSTDDTQGYEFTPHSANDPDGRLVGQLKEDADYIESHGYHGQANWMRRAFARIGEQKHTIATQASYLLDRHNALEQAEARAVALKLECTFHSKRADKAEARAKKAWEPCYACPKPGEGFPPCEVCGGDPDGENNETDWRYLYVKANAARIKAEVLVEQNISTAKLQAQKVQQAEQYIRETEAKLRGEATGKIVAERELDELWRGCTETANLLAARHDTWIPPDEIIDRLRALAKGGERIIQRDALADALRLIEQGADIVPRDIARAALAKAKP